MSLPRLLDHVDAAVRLLTAPPAALFLDIDGTLAPIAPTPGEAEVPPAVRSDLAALSEHLTVAVLTGRAVADARRMVGIEAAVYVGNHGAERWEDGQAAAAPEVAPYLPALRAVAQEAARRFPQRGGYIVEDKGASLSIHYRLAADPERARADALSFAREAGEPGGLRAFEGKMVVEVRAPVDLSKGTALTRLAAERGVKAAAAVGDDTTDIAMFEALRSLREQGALDGFAAAVLGERTPPALTAAADYALDGPGETALFLRRLAERLTG